MNVPIPERWRIRQREIKGCDYAIEVIQQRMHDLEPETEEFGRLTTHMDQVKSTRQDIIDGHRLTNDQRVMIFKILVMAGLGLTIASMSYWYPTAEKTLKFLQLIPK